MRKFVIQRNFLGYRAMADYISEMTAKGPVTVTVQECVEKHKPLTANPLQVFARWLGSKLQKKAGKNDVS